MAQLVANNAYSALASALTNIGTSLLLASGSGARFPSPTGGDYFLLTLVDVSGGTESAWEIVKVTARSADTLTIVRAQEGTSARAWASGTPVDLRITAGTFTSKQDAATAVSKTSATGSMRVPAGTTAQRDVSPSFGDERANSTTGRKEWWDGVAWRMLYDSATLVGSRNRVINGGCRIAQRGTVSLSNSSLQYGGADRHIANLSATTVTGSILQVTGFAGTVTGFGFGVYQATTTGSTSGALIHRIEAQNTRDLSGKTVTVSLKLYHDFGSSTNFGLGLYKANGVDNFSATTQIGVSTTTPVASTTLTTLTASLTLNSTDAANGLQIVVSFTSSALTSKSFYWGDVQLELGAVATSFDERLYGDEFSLCQRYYSELTVPSFYLPSTAATAMYVPVQFKKTMRIPPSITMPSSTNAAYTAAGAGVTPTTFTAVSVSADGFNIVVGNASLGGVASAVYKLSAEL